MKNLRAITVVAALALILALVNWQIIQKRAVIADGALLLLELRPADPRSLFQGDYMALNIAENTMPDPAIVARLPYSGFAILTLDENRVGRFARIDDGGALSANELRVRYRRHAGWFGERLDYGAQSFFFEGGQAALYEAATYAMLRVAEDGSTVLIDLADKDRKALTPAETP